MEGKEKEETQCLIAHELQITKVGRIDSWAPGPDPDHFVTLYGSPHNCTRRAGNNTELLTLDLLLEEQQQGVADSGFNPAQSQQGTIHLTL